MEVCLLMPADQSNHRPHAPFLVVGAICLLGAVVAVLVGLRSVLNSSDGSPGVADGATSAGSTSATSSNSPKATTPGMPSRVVDDVLDQLNKAIAWNRPELTAIVVERTLGPNGEVADPKRGRVIVYVMSPEFFAVYRYSLGVSSDPSVLPVVGWPEQWSTAKPDELLALLDQATPTLVQVKAGANAWHARVNNGALTEVRGLGEVFSREDDSLAGILWRGRVAFTNSSIGAAPVLSPMEEGVDGLAILASGYTLGEGGVPQHVTHKFRVDPRDGLRPINFSVVAKTGDGPPVPIWLVDFSEHTATSDGLKLPTQWLRSVVAGGKTHVYASRIAYFDHWRPSNDWLFRTIPSDRRAAFLSAVSRTTGEAVPSSTGQSVPAPLPPGSPGAAP
jgi:hypothetical protein